MGRSPPARVRGGAVSEPTATDRPAVQPRPVRFTGRSDFLCPWCSVAAVRLDPRSDRGGAQLAREWRSDLLWPEPREPSPEKVRAFTLCWLRPASMAPEVSFVPWATNTPLRSHSVA